MSKKHKKMIARAFKKCGRIYPCGTYNKLAACFSRIDDNLILWYNTVDGSTHIEIRKD